MQVLVTGAAGFIGAAAIHRLLEHGDAVIGIDSLNDYYDPQLKHDRLARLRDTGGERFAFRQVDFSDHQALDAALDGQDFARIVHLGAQAGVRYSLENPRAYLQSNLAGHLNLLEVARHRRVEHLVYASSSSVYGGNARLPFRVEDRVDQPLSLYAATKKADELMSETYAHLYRLPQTGLRFFTVYGPWGRPDMAMWVFTKAILEGRPIQVFGEGRMRRDFTYIDDIITGVVACLDNPPPDDGAVKAGGSVNPHRLYNIGNSRSEDLGDMIGLIEQACGRPAERHLLPMQPGDVRDTFADIGAIQRDLGFTPSTTIAQGIPRFVDWYRAYHGLWRMRRNFYHILGVTPHASEAEVRAAYVHLVKLHHPDVVGDLPARLQEVQDAYRCLMDAPARAAHDRTIAEQERDYRNHQRRVVRRLRKYDERHPHLHPRHAPWYRRLPSRPLLLIGGLIGLLLIGGLITASAQELLD